MFNNRLIDIPKIRVIHLFNNQTNNQNHMTDQSDNYLNLQPLRMLQLFPIRKIQCLEFDLPKYKKLFEVLTCSFCRQIFHNPTYLRCSHRFCKDCIEKHIRKNDKKSCPICRGQLATKRDSKSDLKLISLISFAFGDTASLQTEIDRYEEEAIKNMKFVKTKNGIEMELKRDRPQSMDNKIKNLETSLRKRPSRPNEEGSEEKISFIEKETPAKFEESPKQKQRQMQEQLAEQNANRNQNILQQQQSLQARTRESQISPRNNVNANVNLNPGWTKTKSKGAAGKKKKAEVIQIFSQGSNQLQTGKNNEKMPNGMELNANSSKIVAGYKNLDQFAINTENNKYESHSLQISKKAHQIIKPLEIISQKSEQLFLKVNNFDSELLEARKKLKQKLGDQYLKTLVAKCHKACSILIELLPQSASKLTPHMQKSSILATLNVKISQISKLILWKLNLQHQFNVLELSITSKEGNKIILQDHQSTIFDVVSLFWKDFTGIDFLNLKKATDQKAAQKNRVIYYRVRYGQLQARK